MLTTIVEVDDELEVAHELELQVPRAVQFPAEVTSVFPIVSSSVPAPPPCGGAADWAAVEEPPT